MPEVWKSVGVVDNQNMLQPHALQQKHRVEDGVLIPMNEHRMVPATDLEDGNVEG